MPEFVERETTVEIPKGAGLDGYIDAIRSILSLPRVQSILCKLGGQVTYRRFVIDGEPEAETPLNIQTLLPYMVLRNLGTIEESEEAPVSAAIALGRVFASVARDGLSPIGFTGSGTSVFKWLQLDNIWLHPDAIYGFPYWQDKEIPEGAIFLLASYSRAAKLVDTVKAYKIVLPVRL